VHAIIIICTFSSLSGLIFGCGVTPEVDFKDFAASYGDISDDDDYAPESKLKRSISLSICNNYN
jgi:hypothetical protein